MFLAVSAVSSRKEKSGSVLNGHITVGGQGGGEEIIRKGRKHIGKKKKTGKGKGMLSGLT